MLADVGQVVGRGQPAVLAGNDVIDSERQGHGRHREPAILTNEPGPFTNECADGIIQGPRPGPPARPPGPGRARWIGASRLVPIPRSPAVPPPVRSRAGNGRPVPPGGCRRPWSGAIEADTPQLPGASGGRQRSRAGPKSMVVGCHSRLHLPSPTSYPAAHFPIKFNTASDIVFTPVRIVGSGSG